MKTSLKADLSLLIITIFWGSSYLLMKIGLGGLGTFDLIALRFSIAFILLGVIFFKKLKNTINLKLIKSSLIMGALLSFGFVFMVLGLKYTSTDDASFLTCLSGIFIPIISFIFFKQRLKLKVILSIIIVFIGVYLLTMTGGTLSLNLGDILCLISCGILSFQVIITDKLNRDVDALSLGIFQIGFAALFSMIFTFLFGTFELPQTGTSWTIIIALSILCTAIPYVVQTVSLKYSSPVHAGIIYSLQPVFSAIFVLVFTGVGLTSQGYIGALLMVISIILVEINFENIFSKLKGEKKTLNSDCT